MKNKIIALTDYKNVFGSKHFAIPYRSGFDKELLKKYFADAGFDLNFMQFKDVDFSDIEKYIGTPILYTSSEDIGYHYKSYIEDIVLGLEIIGAQVIPKSHYLRANNNKVFMELLRQIVIKDFSLQAKHFGSSKDILTELNHITFPTVIKEAEGASGTGVALVNSPNELMRKIKSYKNYNYLKEDIKDYLRPYKHKGYIREARFRKKFILQNFIPNLENDWKVYIFGEKLFVFNRPIQKGRGIRASGGGYDNYYYGKQANAPDGMFDFCNSIFKKLGVPHVSLDIAFDGNNFFLIEFQAVYFGTAGIPYSSEYFDLYRKEWITLEKNNTIEHVYYSSIIEFLKHK